MNVFISHNLEDDEILQQLADILVQNKALKKRLYEKMRLYRTDKKKEASSDNLSKYHQARAQNGVSDETRAKLRQAQAERRKREAEAKAVVAGDGRAA